MNNKQREFLQRKILKTGVFSRNRSFCSTYILIEDYSQQIVQSEAVSKCKLSVIETWTWQYQLWQNCQVTNIRSVKVNVNITSQSTFRKWVFNNKWFYNLNHQRCIGRPPTPWCGPFWRPPTPRCGPFWRTPEIYTPLQFLEENIVRTKLTIYKKKLRKLKHL